MSARRSKTDGAPTRRLDGERKDEVGRERDERHQRRHDLEPRQALPVDRLPSCRVGDGLYTGTRGRTAAGGGIVGCGAGSAVVWGASG